MTTSTHIIRPVTPPANFPALSRTVIRAERREVMPIQSGFWQRLMDRLIPFGYEDEQGFHYGFPPRSTES